MTVQITFLDTNQPNNLVSEDNFILCRAVYIFIFQDDSSGHEKFLNSSVDGDFV